MTRIFLIFRPYDGDHLVYRLDEHLRMVFGGANVAATNRLRPGSDVRMEIAHYINASSVILVVIGRRWLEELQRANGQDIVWIAVRTALETPNRTVIPVLIEGALLPEAEHLPPGLGALAYRTPLNLRYDPDFAEDAARLVATIQQHETAFPVEPAPPPAAQTPPYRPVPVQHPRTLEGHAPQIHAPQPQRMVPPPAQPSTGSNPVIAIFRFIGRIIGGIVRFFASLVNTIIHQMLRSTIALVMNIVLMLIIGGFVVMYISALLSNNFDFGLAFSAVIEQISAFISGLFGG